jgi:hypothetical protein
MRQLRTLCVAGMLLLSAGAVLPAMADEGGPPKKTKKVSKKKTSPQPAKISSRLAGQ